MASAGYSLLSDVPDPFASPSNWSTWANAIDPAGSRYSWGTKQGITLPDNFTYGQMPRGGVEFDPVPQGETWDPLSVTLGSSQISGSFDSWMKEKFPQLFSFSDSGLVTNPGEIGSLGGEWKTVDNWNDKILGAVKAVQSETGTYVPPNVVKAIMRIESNGDPSAGPAAGLLQITGSTMGNYDVAKARSNAEYGLYAGIKELALRYQDAQKINKNYTWSNVASGYFSGNYETNSAQDSWTDANGVVHHTSDTEYVSAFNKYWSDLSTGTMNKTTGNPTSTSQFRSVWGGFDAPVTQEFGMTDFAKGILSADPNSNEYAYTAEYTRDRKPMGHAGVDVGLRYGTPLYAPQGGKVTIAGGAGYYCDDDGNGCGPQVGELSLTYPNGDVLILGHMSQITVHQGDTLIPGQFVGYSGSSNGAHVHVEYRKWVGDGVTNSGWEVVDPRGALAGVFGGAYGTTGTGPVIAAGVDDWNTFMKNAALGLPISGAATVGGFHDWLRAKMGVGTAPNVATALPTNADQWIWGDPTTPTQAGGGGGKLLPGV